MFSVSEASWILPVLRQARALNRDETILNFFLYPIFKIETNGFAITGKHFHGAASPTCDYPHLGCYR